MSNDNTVGLFGNPLPIVLVALLAAGVLIKQEELKSARPNDSERVKFVPAGQQNVEARLWQDPFAAIEKYEERSKLAMHNPEERQQSIEKTHSTGSHTEVKAAEQKPEGMPPAPHTPWELQQLRWRIQEVGGPVKVIGVSVFGDPYSEAAENRRRRRFAVISALSAQGYNPAEPEAIGYFRVTISGHDVVRSAPDVSASLDFSLIGPAGSTMLLELVNDLMDPEKKVTNKLSYRPAGTNVGGYLSSSVRSNPKADDLTVPYEWFERDRSLLSGSDKPSYVLVLWLNENKFKIAPAAKLRRLLQQITPDQGNGFWRSKRERQPTGADLQEIFVPSATIPGCDLVASTWVKPWNCFMMSDSYVEKELQRHSILRIIGTDDVLAAALLWELWQRGVNRELVHTDKLPRPVSSKQSANHNATSVTRGCTDGLVLISEWDSDYARALSRNLTEGFLARCRAGGETTSAIRGFTYLRGLDGILPEVDKRSTNVPRKEDSEKTKNLRAQLEEAPPERADGHSQYDYLRRLGDEIARLDSDAGFATNGVKAIGIVGSDVYDKLLILQALRTRFKNKIFFTTDLDARYLHADQKAWARNLVVASNFDLSLHPELQRSTLPFRDGYQTATYLSVLMALENKPLDSWNRKLKDWLRPQIFEIGRTGAVHLASPSIGALTKWVESGYSDGSAPPAGNPLCDDTWATCKSIEPERAAQSFRFDHLIAISLLILLGSLSVALLSPSIQQTALAAYGTITSPGPVKASVARLWLIAGSTLVLAVLAIIAGTLRAIHTSLAEGSSEPFVWLEGISVWPSIILRFVGCVLILALGILSMFWIRRQAQLISERFKLPMPQTWKLPRSRWSAASTGPHLDLASFAPDGSPIVRVADAPVDIASLWQNYLRLTSWREKSWWILASTLIIFLLGFALFYFSERPSFPHRGLLVETLYRRVTFVNALLLWLVIFWVGYETRACAQFVAVLSNVKSAWPDLLLNREEATTGVPRAHLDDYLDFQMIVLATRRIYRLIYLPFVLLLFLVLARSSLFDAMDFPLALIFVTGLALIYAVYTAVLLRKSAEAARAKAIERYDDMLLAEAGAKNPASATDSNAATNPAPISAEQIKLLMERIRSTREGAFARFSQQPALQALLLPFGGYGGVQLLEYLINF